VQHEPILSAAVHFESVCALLAKRTDLNAKPYTRIVGAPWQANADSIVAFNNNTTLFATQPC